MSIKKLLNLIMMALLITLVGCQSDDNEGTFELPTRTVNPDITSNVTNDGAAAGITGEGDFSIVSEINGSAAGVRILESATVYAINAEGLTFSASVNSDGSFSLVGQSMTAPFVLILVPGSSSSLNWQGEVQARIIASTPISNVEVNPVFTAVALSIFQENGFDLFAFAQATIEGFDSAVELLEQFNSILVGIDDAKLNDTLNLIVASWGTTSTGENIISSSLFTSSNYTPRKTMRGVASVDQLFIEALSINFGTTNLAQKLVDNVNSSSFTNGNLLNENGFQEGLVFTMYSLKKYQPFLDTDVYTIINNYFSQEVLDGKKFETTLVSWAAYSVSINQIVESLIDDEVEFNKSEEEIKAKIKSIISTQYIRYYQ